MVVWKDWWFGKTGDLVPNHMIGTPHPNVMICKQTTPFPVEFVVRGYLTGSTETSIWTHYVRGERSYCGWDLSDGMHQHQALPNPLVTPTTKDDEHDQLLSAADVVSQGLMTEEDFDLCAKYALTLFKRGQVGTAKVGCILADTKYEFGKDDTGRIMVIDEIHTSDNSRYWIGATYDHRVEQGLSQKV